MQSGGPLYFTINIADRSQAGPEMYAGSPDLTGFRGYFSSPFLVENNWGSIKVDHDRREQKQILGKILTLIPSTIVDLSSKQ